MRILMYECISFDEFARAVSSLQYVNGTITPQKKLVTGLSLWKQKPIKTYIKGVNWLFDLLVFDRAAATFYSSL